MSKNNVPEEGRRFQAKKKKPFYKRIWFWVLTVLVIVVVGGAVGGHGGNSPKSKSGVASSINKGITLSDYNNIKIGDLANNGDGGDTLKSIKSKFGKPASSSSSTIKNVKTESYTWNKIANADFTSSLVVEFVDGNAVDKAISGLKVKRSNKLDLAAFDSIENGSNESDVLKLVGKPNGYSENIVSGLKTKMIMYTSDIKGDAGANFNVTLQGDSVTAKSQISMK